MTDLIRSACLASYPGLARSLGLDPLRMLDAAGIDRRCLEDPDTKFPSGAIGRLLEISAKATGVEDFGLRLAEMRTLSVLGPIGLLLREEPTVRDAVRSLMRYIPLHNQSISLTLEERDGMATISVQLRARRLVPIRQGTELAIGVLYRVLRQLIGSQWRPVACFSHDAPQHRDSYRRLFSGRIEFGHDFNGIVCESRDLDRAIPTSDATLARYARRHLDDLMGRPHTSLADKVRELVSLQLSTGRCRIDLIASQLNVDRRTLHRKLADEDTTFSDLLGEIRTEIVTRALPGRDRTLGALADMLGFSSLSAFSRWFQMRFGTSPSAWRNRTAAPPAG